MFLPLGAVRVPSRPMAYDPSMPAQALRWSTMTLVLLAALAAAIAGAARGQADEMRSVPAERQAGKVAVTPITGPIDEVSLAAT